MLQPKTAEQIMVTKLVTLAPDKHVYDGIAGLLKYRITGAPVIDKNRKFLGVFSEKCCMNVLTVMARSANDDAPSKTTAKDFMTKKLVTLSPATDVFDAIELLLTNRISGAPVIDDTGKFLGVFSEKNSMQVLLSAAYDQMPTTRVEALMNPDEGRVISPDMGLLDVAQMFIDTPFRRLDVVEDGKLVGQISRRDVLQAQQQLSKRVRHRVKVLSDQIAESNAQYNHVTDSNEAGKNETDSSEANSAAFGEPASESHQVGYFMDRSAKTIPSETGFLGIARVFLDTPYRRLPVVDDGKLVGQISRRDLLHAANELISVPTTKSKNILYLSSLVDREDSPFS